MIKTCSVCGDPISERARSGMCKRCRHKVYYEANTKKAAAANKVYREKNKEAIAARHKAWLDANPEKVAAQQKKYRDENPEKVKAWAKVYRDENPAKVKARNSTWRDENPDKAREHRHERRKYLSSYAGCKKLNQWFPGCEFHHLAPDTGVHVPATLHRSASHSLKTGEGMEEMNALAMEWLHGARRESPQTTLEAFG